MGLFTRLNGGRLFSKIDLSEAYLQLSLSENTKEVETSNTHRGLYRYNQLPLGVKCASANFQQKMDLPLAIAYVDDIVVLSSSTSEHEKYLRILLDRIRD